MTTRRDFLRTAALYGTAFAGLRMLTRHGLFAANTPSAAVGFGPLMDDPDDILRLPAGFSYVKFSAMGEEMVDGLLVPGSHDGMAAFMGPGGRTLLVRNHELESSARERGPYGLTYERFNRVDPTKIYDRGGGVQPSLGGTTTLVFDTRTQRLESHFLSLVGTERNCAGGPTPWGTWVTCEEINAEPEAHAEQLHGYNFEVAPSVTPGLVDPVPLKAMGRFRHEAVAIDPRSGCVYETEDLADGLLYRFIPDKPGRLAAGGRLQALKLRDRAGGDTRNWSGTPPFPLGEPVPVEWIDLDEIDSPQNDLRHRGAA
ncbi:MAG TPA: alkaline phosphatase PhoX, partial [Candidatus Synoicihabitans sp.]|nr:alkaline phosphatase PhoX [Candidatus Synoicihabitans sp.]